MPSVFLDELTEPEVAHHLERGARLLVPTGSTEQHGPHGPLGTDVVIPREVCRRVAEQLGASSHRRSRTGSQRAIAASRGSRT